MVLALDVLFEGLSLAERLKLVRAEFGEISVELHFQGLEIIDAGLGAVEIDDHLVRTDRKHAQDRKKDQNCRDKLKGS